MKILFCTDFSPNADFAFGYALRAARTAGEETTLFLLHVIPEPEAQFWKTYVYEVENADEKAQHDIDARIEAYRVKVPAGVAFKPVYRVGRDEAEILAFAEEETVDLIVMGRQGKGEFQKVFFGNVTEKVARKAPCPVLIVPLSYKQRVNGDNRGAEKN